MTKFVSTLFAGFLPILGWCTLERADVGNLSQRDAELRKSLVENPRYHLDFNFVLAEQDQVHGIADIFFDLKTGVPDDQTLTLDNEKGTLKSVTINDQVQPLDVIVKKTYIVLPTTTLKVGTNHIEIHFDKDLKEPGQGLYKMVDQSDKKIYIYSDLEPYKAHMIFPCFDQPDLKAKFNLIVAAPAGWEVMTNTPSLVIDPHGRTTHNPARWTFKESLPMSTYLFALHVGEYKVWTDTTGKIPLRLFARQSLAKYVDAKEWFDLTQAGFAFYEKYYAFPYPFEKYDQLLAPDFLWGGMENIGAVTYSESYIARGPKTWLEKSRLASTLLHEMAHMWFGDLVTMRWWNDLWLNESFADFMATKALREATPYRDSWMAETFNEKPWAYDADTFSTTHPVAGPAETTDVALANFDGITYGKGGADLKQLNFLLGDQAFTAGLQSYFQKYQFGNATLRDFLAELETASGHDLKAWAHEWVETAGVNSVTVSVKCENRKIQSLVLEQAPAAVGANILREQKTEIALFNATKVYKTFDVTLQNRTEVAAAVGLDCPTFVQPNNQDNAFFLVNLDATTLSNLPTGLHALEDPQTRALFWVALWQMVKDGKFSLEEYIAVIQNNLTFETDPRFVQLLARTLTGFGSHSAEAFADRASEPLRLKLVTTLENFFWQKSDQSRGDAPTWKAWFSLYLGAAESPGARTRLIAILTNQLEVDYTKLLDQDLRWALLQRLSQLGQDDAEVHSLLETEKTLDGSRRGQLAYEASNSMRPSLELKQARLDKLRTDLTVGAGDLGGYSMLFSSHQASLFNALMERSYQTLIESLGKRDDQFLEDLAGIVMPMVCTPDHLARAEKLIHDNASNMTPVVLKAVQENRDRIKTCVQVKMEAGR